MNGIINRYCQATVRATASVPLSVDEQTHTHTTDQPLMQFVFLIFRSNNRRRCKILIFHLFVGKRSSSRLIWRWWLNAKSESSFDYRTVVFAKQLSSTHSCPHPLSLSHFPVIWFGKLLNATVKSNEYFVLWLKLNISINKKKKKKKKEIQSAGRTRTQNSFIFFPANEKLLCFFSVRFRWECVWWFLGRRVE